MFDLGMSELLVIGIVALIVIGPKDLPGLFRSLGRFTAKMRTMAREFSRAMEAAADESGVKDVAKDIKAVTSTKSMGLDAIKDATDRFEKWDPLKNAARPTPPSAPAPTANPSLAPSPVVSAVAEAAPAPALGPATQALADERAARKAVALEAAEKLAKPVRPAASTAAPIPAESAAAPVKKPRAPRKPKPDNSGADA